MKLDDLREALENESNVEYLLGDYDGLSSMGVVTTRSGVGYAIEIHIEPKKHGRFPKVLHLADGVAVPVRVDEDFVLPYFN